MLQSAAPLTMLPRDREKLMESADHNQSHTISPGWQSSYFFSVSFILDVYTLTIFALVKVNCGWIWVLGWLRKQTFRSQYTRCPLSSFQQSPTKLLPACPSLSSRYSCGVFSCRNFTRIKPLCEQGDKHLNQSHVQMAAGFKAVSLGLSHSSQAT